MLVPGGVVTRTMYWSTPTGGNSWNDICVAASAMLPTNNSAEPSTVSQRWSTARFSARS